MKYLNYLWDFDGTLFDSYPHIAASCERALDAHGIPYRHEDVLRELYRNFLCAKQYYAMTEEIYREFHGYEADWAQRPSAEPFPDTVRVLRAITEAGGRNFLYTHRDKSAREYLRLYGMEKYFSGFVDSGLHFPAKPAPDAVEFLCRNYGLDKAQTVMVGDREIDVLSGVNAGVAGCLLRTHPVEEETTAAADVADTMADFARVMEIPLPAGITGEMLDAIRGQAAAAAAELIGAAKVTRGQIVVVGCSSSEIVGEKIGSDSSPEVARAVLDGILPVLQENGIYLAAQCCEHLNRALIVERAAAANCEIVNVIPMPKAGGSFAAAAWRTFDDPVAVAAIPCDAGLDIGGTLIGMHLKHVAVPLRLSVKTIGQASLTAARVRPPFVGGERAVYASGLM